MWPVVIAIAVVTPTFAVSAPDADAILQQALDNYRAGSSAPSVAMTVHRPEWERHLKLKAWTRAQDDALVRFVAPAKDAGNAAGSAFSYNDLAKSNDIITDYTHRHV
jgi:hypothetical protein